MKFSTSATIAAIFALLAPTALANPLIATEDGHAISGEPVIANHAPVAIRARDSADFVLEPRKNKGLNHKLGHSHGKRTWAFRQVILDHHNAHRKNHSAPALVYNATMENNAKVLAQRCVWQHNTSIGGGGYGQNLAAGIKRHDIGVSITNLWYGEAPAYKPYYGTPNPPVDAFGSVGHFTQLVWKTTTAVGCFTYNCAGSGHLKDDKGNVMANGMLDNFTVCNYYPPGNWWGDFADNVLKPIGLPPYTGP